MHTPGPWSVIPSTPQESFNCFWIEHETKSSRGRRGVADVQGPQSSAEAQANARLIAAAPDLLEACRLAVGYLAELDVSKAVDPETLVIIIDACQEAIIKTMGIES